MSLVGQHHGRFDVVVRWHSVGVDCFKLRKRLKWLRHTLGRRRDVDMILGKLKERAANTASARRRRILRAVIRQMTPEAKQITRKMYRATTKAGLKKLRRMTDKALGGRGFNAPSLEVLDAAIWQAEQRWLAAINTAKLRKDAAGYHDVRIKTKTLRYMIETVSRFVELPGAEAADMYRPGIFVRQNAGRITVQGSE